MGEAVHVRSISALRDLRSAFGRFAGEVREPLTATELEIRRALQWIEERVRYWQREVEDRRHEVQRASAALARCRKSGYHHDDRDYHEPDCSDYEEDLSAARQHLREAEAERATVHHWAVRLNQAVKEYQIHANRLKQLTTTRHENAQAFLQRRQAELEAYIAIKSPDSMAGLAATISPVPEGRHGLPSWDGGHSSQAQVAAVALQALQGLQSDEWQKLDFRERLEVLQKVENSMAEVQGRPSVQVNAEVMGKPTLFGVYDGTKITLNDAPIKENDIRGVLDTVIHEGRHAYQHYAVTHPGIHPKSSEVEAWRDNRDHYLDAELYGQEMYQNQPVEADAWSYADAVVERYYQGGNSNG